MQTYLSKHVVLALTWAGIGLMGGGCLSRGGLELLVVEHNREYGDLRARHYGEAVPTEVTDGHDADAAMVAVDFIVVVKNASAEPIYLYEEWNSMGCGLLEIDVKINGGEPVALTKRELPLTRNVPTLLEIPAGGCLAYPVMLDEITWHNAPSVPPQAASEIRARLYTCMTGKNGRMVIDRRGPIESKWTQVMLRGKRLAAPSREIWIRGGNP
jgi:hypothetical protein